MTRAEKKAAGFNFPWQTDARANPLRMRWESSDPTEQTWVVFLFRLEHERQTKILDLCKEYNTDPRFAARVFEKYKKWREGRPFIPPVDVVAALREIREAQNG